MKCIVNMLFYMFETGLIKQPDFTFYRATACKAAWTKCEWVPGIEWGVRLSLAGADNSLICVVVFSEGLTV